MYHYFEAREFYNAIRVFIAAYVWMTGFGNFSYYYVRKDFSLGRFAQVHNVVMVTLHFPCDNAILHGQLAFASNGIVISFSQYEYGSAVSKKGIICRPGSAMRNTLLSYISSLGTPIYVDMYSRALLPLKPEFVDVADDVAPQLFGLFCLHSTKK
jgi:hypothetical protein